MLETQPLSHSCKHGMDIRSYIQQYDTRDEDHREDCAAQHDPFKSSVRVEKIITHCECKCCYRQCIKRFYCERLHPEFFPDEQITYGIVNGESYYVGYRGTI